MNSRVLPQRRHGRLRLSLVALATLVAIVSVDAPLTAAAPSRETSPAGPCEVPGLSSGPAPERVLDTPAGDFTRGAILDPTSESVADRPPPFDPQRSVVVEEETTPTRRVWRNEDGSFTAEIHTTPVRERDPATGEWRDLDLTLVEAPDGSLRAKAASGAARLGGRSGGDVATVDTPAGPIVLRHPRATPAPAQRRGSQATYPRALPGGVDLTLAPTPDGFKETAILPSASAPASYTDEFVLPDGVAARQGEDGVEFVDASGAVVGRFGGGVAYDASFPQAGLGATSPVEVRLVALEGGTATVEVAIPEEWLADPSRRFPVTIDPAYFTEYTTPGTGNRDAFVANLEYASTSWATHPWLVVGNSDGSHIYRSML